MAKASKFTKVSIICSWTIEEAKAVMEMMEHCHVSQLTTNEQILVSGVHQSLRKAMNDG